MDEFDAHRIKDIQERLQTEPDVDKGWLCDKIISLSIQTELKDFIQKGPPPVTVTVDGGPYKSTMGDTLRELKKVKAERDHYKEKAEELRNKMSDIYSKAQEIDGYEDTISGASSSIDNLTDEIESDSEFDDDYLDFEWDDDDD